MTITSYKLLKGASKTELGQAAQTELALADRVLLGNVWTRGAYMYQAVGVGVIETGKATGYFLVSHTNEDSLATLINTQLPYYQPIGIPIVYNSTLYQVMAVVAHADNPGTPGKSPVLRVSGGYIQWKYDTDTTWTNLVALSAITGPSVQIGVDDGYIKWKQSDSPYWEILVSLSDLTGPQGPVGEKGEPGSIGPTGATGPANSLTVGTVTTGTAAATITGTAPSQTLNLTLPNFNPLTPVSRTVTIGTAYQHTDTTKAYRATVNVRATQVLTIAGTAADKLELRVGPTSASVAASGSGGFSIGVWESGITGIALMIGAGIQDGGAIFADVPAGWYFQINRLSGANATVVSCFTQTMGV